MKTHLVIVFILFFHFGEIFPQKNNYFDILTFKELNPRLNLNNDTVYIINFWATWCIPCRKELPEFEKASKQFANQKVKVLLVSLDFPNQQEALKLFIEKNQISSEVIILNAPDANNWINKVDENWSGSIPATLFYRKNIKKFYESELDFKTIETQIISMLNP